MGPMGVGEVGSQTVITNAGLYDDRLVLHGRRLAHRAPGLHAAADDRLVARRLRHPRLTSGRRRSARRYPVKFGATLTAAGTTAGVAGAVVVVVVGGIGQESVVASYVIVT